MPYIGVAGIATIEEAHSVALLGKQLIPPSRKLMLGYLVSTKTYRGEKNKYPYRYPLAHRLHAVIADSRGPLNYIHFSASDDANLSSILDAMAKQCGELLDGFQLNIASPDPLILRRFKEKYPRLGIVLQVGPRIQDELQHMPVRISEHLKRYVGIVDYALIDVSGGKGIPMDLTYVTALIDLLSMQVDMGLGVAGGLNGIEVGKLSALLRAHPDLSLDAEGKLRTNEDELVEDKVRAYLANASAVCKAAQEYPGS